MKIQFPLACLLALSLAACKPPAESADHGHGHEQAPAVTNRVPIPDAVRRNLGMSFAKAKVRPVARTLRLGGQIKALPEAREQLTAPMAGRVHWRVGSLEQVKAGQVVAELDSPAFRQWVAAKAQGASDIRRLERLLDENEGQAGTLHAQLAAQRNIQAVWKSRLAQLRQAGQAGGAVAESLAAAQVALAQTQANMAGLEAEQVRAKAELDAARLQVGNLDAQFKAWGMAPGELPALFPLRTSGAGQVVSMRASEGAWVEAGSALLETLDPTRMAGQAMAPAGDGARLRDGLPCMLQMAGQAEIPADLQLSPQAEAGNLHVVAKPKSVTGLSLREGFPVTLSIALDGPQAPALAIPKAALVSDGATPVLFRRDPQNPDQAIRMQADIGASDGAFVEILSGLKAGDEVVVDGAWQLMLATSGSSPKGGHFHADGTFHEGNHEKGGK